MYDRRERKRVVKEWCDKVEYLSKEPLAANEFPRKVTVWLANPPGDSPGPARTIFHEYVKPVLCAGAVDYELRESMRPESVRYTLAKELRSQRADVQRKLDELATSTAADQAQWGSSLISFLGSGRERSLENKLPSMQSIIIGRHTYKEYMYGLHEGILGPLENPHVQDELTPADESPTEEDKTQQEKKPEVKPIPLPYITPLEYTSQSSIPIESLFTPESHQIQVIPLPWLLGFMRTPWRIYRFLNRRTQAEESCRLAAAAVLDVDRPWSPDDVNIEDSEQSDWPKDYQPDGKNEVPAWTAPITVSPLVTDFLRIWRRDLDTIA